MIVVFLLSSVPLCTCCHYSCSDLSVFFLHTAGASWHRTHSNKAPFEAKSVKTSVSLQKHTLNCTKCGKHFFYITEFVSAKSSNSSENKQAVEGVSYFTFLQAALDSDLQEYP